MKTTKLFLLCFILTICCQIITAQKIQSKLDEKTNLYGFVDCTGKYLVKPIYKEVDLNFGDKKGLSKVKNQNGKAGFVNTKGKEIVPCKYDDAEDFENGYAVVKIKTNELVYQYGLIDSTGKEVISTKYERMEYYPKDKILVIGDGSTSNVRLMELNRKMIVPDNTNFSF